MTTILEKTRLETCPKNVPEKCARAIFDDSYTLLALFELQKCARRRRRRAAAAAAAVAAPSVLRLRKKRKAAKDVAT